VRVQDLLRRTEALHRPALRALLAAPDPVRRAVAGPARTHGGRVMDLEAQVALRLSELVGSTGIDGGHGGMEERRRGLDHQCAVIGGLPAVAGVVEDRTVPGPAGPVPVRLYTPGGAAGRRADAGALLMYLHGGAWNNGSLDSHDALCRAICAQARIRVAAVGYRLAPEQPYPAGLEDCWAVWTWLHDQADVLGGDTGRLAVGGDSAGGNLAAVLAQRAAGRGEAVPAAQVLVYPATDFSRRSRSRDELAGVVLTDDGMDEAELMYLGTVVGGHDRADPSVSPLLATELAGLPPAVVITAGFDPLRDEGDAYAEALVAAGVPVDHWCEDGWYHGFAQFTGVGRSGPAAVSRLTAAIRRLVSDFG